MKMWFAGVRSGAGYNVSAHLRTKNNLVPFPEVAAEGFLQSMMQSWETAIQQPTQFAFFLDSGAYSAWSRGVPVDIDEYCAFIKANIEVLEVYAVLDSIPGKLGGPSATTAERNWAAEQTWNNYLFMKAEGLDPIPVYHYGEDMRFLDRMLDYGCEYIGIGGLVGVSTEPRKLWLDRTFSKITDDFGAPLIKTHGFGMTAVPLIFRYPWHSVDSTSWLHASANGCVLLPARRHGEFVFDRVPTPVVVSKQRAIRGTDSVSWKTSTSMTPGVAAILQEWLAMAGVTLQQVSEDYGQRSICNTLFFCKVAELKGETPFRLKRLAQRSSIWGERSGSGF